MAAVNAASLLGGGGASVGYSVNPTATSNVQTSTGAKGFNPGGINVGFVLPPWAIPASILAAVVLGGIYLWKR